MFKKIMALICAMVMVLAVAGCTNDNQPTVNSGNSSKDDTTSQNSSKDDVSSDDTSSGNSSDKNNVSYYDDAEEGGNAWGEVDNSSITSSGGNNVTTAKEFDLKSVKQLVFPKYNSSYLTTLALEELQAAYKSKAKLDLKIVKDNAGTKDYELLVGKTSRTTMTKVTAVNSYTISWKGTKLMIDGGSPRAINAAIAVLEQKIQDGDFILKKAIKGTCKDNSGKVGDYTETYTDDFTGNTISTVWNKYSGTEGSESRDGKHKTNVTFKTLNLSTVKDGKLFQKVTLDNVSKQGDVTVYDASRPKMTTQNAFWFQYGYTEASIKATTGEGVGSAYWLHGKNNGLGSIYCEYDILELLGNPRINQFSPFAWEVEDNGNGGTKNQNHWYFGIGNNTSDYYWANRWYGVDGLGKVGAKFGEEYHTFGMEWDKDYYKITLDGEVIMSVKYSDMPEQFGGKRDYFTKAEMVGAYREPVFFVLDINVGQQSWRNLADYSKGDMSKNNWVDDNISCVDYCTLYQKAGQLNGKSFEAVKNKMK